MDSFNSPAPIPTPDGQTPVSMAPKPLPGDWQTAPKVVKGWAYPLSWLYLGFFTYVIYVGVSSNESTSAEKSRVVAIILLMMGFIFWLNRSLKKGVGAAWIAQVIVSILGLLAFPLGTLIHGYILSQWFKAENKAWFGLRGNK